MDGGDENVVAVRAMDNPQNSPIEDGKTDPIEDILAGSTTVLGIEVAQSVSLAVAMTSHQGCRVPGVRS